MKRNLILSPAFKEFEQNANPRTREKLRYAISILETVYPVPTKFVKKLVGTDFFELRVSVDNEIRVILLNGFVKKSTKDYDKEITKAINILRSVL